MPKFIIKYAEAKAGGFMIEESHLGLSALQLSISLELVGSGDFSEYFDENNILDRERIIKDIVSGKIKINE